MRENNRLYEACEAHLGQIDDELKVTFGLHLGEERKIRRNDVNTLYFSILDSILPEQLFYDLYNIKHYLRANCNDESIINKMDKIHRSIHNGTKYE